MMKVKMNRYQAIFIVFFLIEFMVSTLSLTYALISVFVLVTAPVSRISLMSSGLSSEAMGLIVLPLVLHTALQLFIFVKVDALLKRKFGGKSS